MIKRFHNKRKTLITESQNNLERSIQNFIRVFLGVMSAEESMERNESSKPKYTVMTGKEPVVLDLDWTS